jgi:hypothetical protein
MIDTGDGVGTEKINGASHERTTTAGGVGDIYLFDEGHTDFASLNDGAHERSVG